MSEKQNNNDTTAPTASEDQESTKTDFVKTGVLVSATGIGMFMSALDESIINVSIVSMADYFHTDQTHVQWIVLVYLLVIVGLSAIAGYLGDRYSTKLIFQIGMVIFSIGSLLCAVSNTLGMLIGARIVQGIGAAGILANGNALVTRFTKDEQRGLAIGLTALIAALGVVVGPVIGALLTQYVGWNFIFWLNVPIGIIGIIYLQFALPATPSVNKENHKGDPFGSILFALFMIMFISAITLFVEPLLARPMLWSAIVFGVSMLFLATFILWEKRAKNPFIDLALFKNKKFTIGVFCALITYISLNSIAFQLPFFMQKMLDYEYIKIGAVIIGVPIGLAITAPLSGKLSSKFDARLLSSIGLIAIGISLLCLAIFLSLNIHLAVFILISTIIGLAIGVFVSPNSNSVMSSVKKEKLGIVSSLLSLSRNIGYSIGTALSTTIFYSILKRIQISNPGSLLDDSINYVPAMQILFGILTGFVVIGVIISFLRGPEHKALTTDITIGTEAEQETST
ncbi:MAG: MFS transporter [Candidatus Heimdallarchaeota archaeon]